MALLFSHVKVQADGNEMNFFVCGVPTTASDLDNYTVYQEFLDELDGKTDIDITVKSYLYGEGEVLEANIYEVAYFTIRQAQNETFLSRCEEKGEKTISYTYCPTEQGFEQSM